LTGRVAYLVDTGVGTHAAVEIDDPANPGTNIKHVLEFTERKFDLATTTGPMGSVVILNVSAISEKSEIKEISTGGVSICDTITIDSFTQISCKTKN
jgi:hypothetical protein